jgi:NAD-dependent DNA ligase
MSAASIAKQLAAASKAYYETGKPVMSDTEYDSLKEKLERLDPDHPYLQQVGAPVSEGAVQLPHHMPSLKKVKPDTLGSVKLSGPFVISEKLDGVSALWVCGINTPPRLLLRGDGSVGQDVSFLIKHIQGLKQCGLTNSVAVRGELIVPKATVPAARNWVNGLIHQKNPSVADLNKIHFVAYSVYQPRNLTRSQQMTWLENQGFEVAWYTSVGSLESGVLSSLFKSRRTESIYECDGIVVGTNTIPLATTEATPKDAFAYKEAVDDQRAETTVIDVEYASSRTGQWIPRIHVEPVRIGNATIEYCTGFNAAFIEENQLGPRARVILRRSGDVIPTLDSVRIVAPGGWQQPPSGRWKWDGTHINALDTSVEKDSAKLALELVHTLTTFGVERVSEASALKLVEGGLKTIHQVKGASITVLQELLGPTNGKNLHEALAKGIAGAGALQWILAYPNWPKGFGERKATAALEACADVAGWPKLTVAPKGQTMKTFEEVQKAVPAYLAWREGFGPRVVTTTPPPKVTATPEAVPTLRGYYVMTGFRDPVLQETLRQKGWELQDRVTKSTAFLLVADNSKETTKVKAARDAGLKIVSRSQVLGEM